jgi:hypothetical protein
MGIGQPMSVAEQNAYGAAFAAAPRAKQWPPPPIKHRPRASNEYVATLCLPVYYYLCDVMLANSCLFCLSVTIDSMQICRAFASAHTSSHSIAHS